MKRTFSWLALAACSFAWISWASSVPTTRKIWADARTNLLGGLSPDGESLSFVDPSTGDLAVYDLRNGQTRVLVKNPPDAQTFAYFSAFSRDGERIAYAWFNDEGFYELWTVNAEGGAPRRLYSNPETGFVQPCDWSLDGSEILTLFFRKDNVSQIALVSADDGSVRILKTLSWFYPKKISFSPDGRFILYDSITGRDEAARDILLLSADGSSERKLIEHPANDIFPAWTPAGDGVVFASDRSGEMDLWLAPFHDGGVGGEPRRIARSFGRALPLGVSADGVYYYGVRAGRSDVVTASFRDGRLGEPSIAGIRTVGRNTAPAWSHDGKRLAYLTQLGTENYGRESRGVAVWSPATRQETLLVPSLAFISQLHWSPDDRRLLASGSDGRGRSGLFTVDPDTGAVEGLIRIHGGNPQGLEGVWLDNGSIAYVSADRAKLMRFGLENRTETALFEAPSGAEIRRLAANPSGEWIAFGVAGSDGEAELWALQIADGENRRLMEVKNATISAVAWAGDAIFATVPGSGGAAVWRVGLDGGGPVKTALGTGEGGPRFTPDGERIAYIQADQREEVWALEGWLPKAEPLRSRSDAASRTPPGAP